ncbi:uncharacterized protein LOC117509730 [Thalassophryne amazonica]|uniref:uncharacterized protein LOC117509730 n=1 Tax=Thalassophryne amazonica TaxID=390379 RepID=UPI001470D5DD|nr:uncharacterized protein LOC117509730 [Thalassophryne amazonica]
MDAAGSKPVARNQDDDLQFFFICFRDCFSPKEKFDYLEQAWEIVEANEWLYERFPDLQDLDTIFSGTTLPDWIKHPEAHPCSQPLPVDDDAEWSDCDDDDEDNSSESEQFVVQDSVNVLFKVQDLFYEYHDNLSPQNRRRVLSDLDQLLQAEPDVVRAFPDLENIKAQFKQGLLPPCIEDPIEFMFESDITAACSTAPRHITILDAAWCASGKEPAAPAKPKTPGPRPRSTPMQAPSRAPPKSAPRVTHVASTRSLRTEAEPASSCPTSQRLRATTTAVLSLPPVPAPRQPCAPVPPKTVRFAPAAAPVSTPAAPATLPAGPVSMRTAPATGAISAPAAPPAEPVSVRITPAVAPDSTAAAPAATPVSMPAAPATLPAGPVSMCTAPATGAISAPAAPPAEPVSVRITPAVAPDSTPAAPAATPVSMPAAPATLPAGPVSMCTAPATGAISAPAAPPAEPVSVRITPAVAPDSTPAAPAAAPVSTPAAPATLPASPVSMRNAPATGAISTPAAPATAPDSTPTAALDFARTTPAPVPAHAAPQPVSRPDGASFARMPSEPSPPAPPHPAPASLPAQKMTIEDANLEMVSDILLELYLLRVYFVLTLFTSVLCWFKAPRLLLGWTMSDLDSQFQSVMTWLLGKIILFLGVSPGGGCGFMETFSISRLLNFSLTSPSTSGHASYPQTLIYLLVQYIRHPEQMQDFLVGTCVGLVLFVFCLHFCSFMGIFCFFGVLFKNFYLLYEGSFLSCFCHCCKVVCMHVNVLCFCTWNVNALCFACGLALLPFAQWLLRMVGLLLRRKFSVHHCFGAIHPKPGPDCSLGTTLGAGLSQGRVPDVTTPVSPRVHSPDLVVTHDPGVCHVPRPFVEPYCRPPGGLFPALAMPSFGPLDRLPGYCYSTFPLPVLLGSVVRHPWGFVFFRPSCGSPLSFCPPSCSPCRPPGVGFLGEGYCHVPAVPGFSPYGPSSFSSVPLASASFC